MIKIENVVLASPEQMEFIIQGMRNPMNSWDRSDSRKCNPTDDRCYGHCDELGCLNVDHKVISMEEEDNSKDPYADQKKRLKKLEEMINEAD